MNFGMIFLCLLFGGIIGFEVGKYTMSKKINDILKTFADTIKKETEEAQKKRDAVRERLNDMADQILNDLKKMEDEAREKKSKNGGTKGNIDQETIDRIYEIEASESDKK